MLTTDVIEGFVNSVLAKGFNERVKTPGCHREWWELCCSKNRFVAIAAPRGFAKSTAITHSFVLAALLFRERNFAIVVSDTETQAVLFLQDIKKELQDNDDLIALFDLKRDKEGKVLLAKETESDIIVEMNDGHRFRIMAKGSEQKVRGLKWGHKRPDLIVCDDLENDEIVLNKERREKFRRWFYGALLPCRSDNGIVRVVGTILHMDSLLERLMPEFQLSQVPGGSRLKLLERNELQEFTSYRLPWRSIKYRAHNPDFSSLLWEEKMDETTLRAKRADYIAQGMPDVYAQEYLNVPLDESTAFFKKSDFRSILTDEKDKKLNYYITADLAISSEQKADYTVFVIAGVDEDKRIQIKNVIRERGLDGREIVDTLIALQRSYDPVAIGIEKSQISQSIGPFLNEAMIISNTYINLIPMEHMGKDKVTRSRSIQARVRAQSVKFDKEADWYQAFEDEAVRFPRDKHDDQVDAFAYLGLMLDKLVEAPTIQELNEIEYRTEYEQSGLLEIGRDPVTGY